MSKTGSVPLNVRYLNALAARPLLTKALTAAVLGSLNEQIASLIAGDFQTLKVDVQNNGKKVTALKLLHTLTPKVPLLALYGFAVGAPLAHYGYDLLNRIFKAPLSSRQKVLQILTSMLTLTPLSGACFVAFLALINLKPAPSGTSTVKHAARAIVTNWRNNLLAILKTSWAVGPVVTFLAQTYVPPPMWVVFFNVVYFFTGTGQNALVKIKMKKLAQKQAEAEKKQE